MYTLGNLGVRRVQDASAKRMVGRRKITRETSAKYVRFCEHLRGSVNTVSVMAESINSDVDRLEISMHDLSIDGK